MCSRHTPYGYKQILWHSACQQRYLPGYQGGKNPRSSGRKQQVEILKLLYRKSSILIFDEPTAVLTPKEAENLFTTMRMMAGFTA